MSVVSNSSCIWARGGRRWGGANVRFWRIRYSQPGGSVFAMAHVLISSRPVKQAVQPRRLLGLGDWGGSSGENACFCYQMVCAADIGSRIGLAKDRRCANFPDACQPCSHAAPQVYLIHIAIRCTDASLLRGWPGFGGCIYFFPGAGLSVRNIRQIPAR